MRKQIPDPHTVGVGDITEPIGQLIGDAWQLSTSLTHACQESIPIRHVRRVIDDRAGGNR